LNRRRLRLPAALATAFVLLTAALGPRAGSALLVSAPLVSPDAIVSLASHEWERLPAAAALAARYPEALVVLTEPQHVTAVNCHDCYHRADRLVAAGVEASRIRIISLTAGGTYGEAIAIRAFLADRQLTRALIVTSPYHTRRSLATFRAVLPPGVAVGMASAGATSPARPERWWADPYDRAYVRYEWAAIAYYWARYGISPGSPAPNEASHAGD
jgi:uncharacterized SAM-binding protein YcdF (DUF218 family)